MNWYPPPGLPPINSLPNLQLPLMSSNEINPEKNIISGNNCIFVWNIPSYTTYDDLYKFFSQYGSVSKIETYNIYKHYCHIYMKSAADASKIVTIKYFNFLNCQIGVEFRKHKNIPMNEWQILCARLIKEVTALPDDIKYDVGNITIVKEITDNFRKKDINTCYNLFRELINDYNLIIKAVVNTPSIIKNVA
jgi:RNA recognition motif-containing protein